MVSAAAALLVALSPLNVLAAQSVLEPELRELSPVEMLVKKTTDIQVHKTVRDLLLTV